MKNLPFVCDPFIDKIAYLLPWGKKAAGSTNYSLDKVRQKLEKAISAARCERAYPIGARYKLNFWINLSGCRVLVQLGALQKRQKGGLRISLNPRKLAKGDVKLLHRTLRRLLGASYDELASHPLINVLHVAVDVEHLDLTKTLVSYSHGHRMTVVSKCVRTRGAVLESLNFGSVSSDYVTAVYEKRTERIHRAALRLARSQNLTESLKTTRVAQLKAEHDRPVTVRVECRYLKLRGLEVSELSALKNRFTRLQFAALGVGPTQLAALTEKSFLALAATSQVKSALAAFDGDEQARHVRRYWKERQCGWWNPKTLWPQVAGAVVATGLFPSLPAA